MFTFKMWRSFNQCLILICFMPSINYAEDIDLNDLSERQNAVRIHKCCEHNELMVDGRCRLASTYNISVWEPTFKTEDGKDTTVKYHKEIHGQPDCETTQLRPIYSFKQSEDQLQLLPDGRMRHLIYHEHKADSIPEDPSLTPSIGLYDPITIPEVREPAAYTHVPGKYCMDKNYMTKTNMTVEYALVCVPDVLRTYKDPDFVLKKILNPLFHAISMILLLITAIIYFVLPTLRDLAGNIITSINVCLIFGQAADLVRVFTEFSNHVSFMIADIILYISLLGAFFWLNGFGFYIWKTFNKIVREIYAESRNVFLRVTDVRKYCYYSAVVWSTVVVMTAMAICAHFLLDTGTHPNRKTHTQFSSSILTDDAEQETIGWLGIAIFFTPVAFTILFNIFFCVTTMKVIKRINIYGRIHYKLKGCFDLFIQLFLIMSVTWLFLLLSWIQYNGLIYAHIFINLLQGILIFYVCVVRQSHVKFLLRKSCFYAEPVPTNDWGDEMTQMNGTYVY